MKIKIVEQGWEGFSGNLGMVLFEDGVSVRDVTPVEANIVAGNIRVVNFEDESSVGAIGMDADIQNIPCVSSSLQTLEEILSGREAGIQVIAQIMSGSAQESAKAYTQAELEAIADKDGIAGLREIGDSIGVKSTSIGGLIEAILAKQSPAPVVAPLAEGQPEVVTKEQA